MGIDEVLKLINLLQDTDVQEVEVAEGDRRIKIVRMGPKSRVDDNSIPSAESSSVNIKNSEEDVEKSETNENHVELVSPMVGTFYRSPEPDAEPFVKEEDQVSSGQQLCIVEAMKLMNPIQSELNGRVVAVLVEDGQPVEYGQTLFLIEPT